MIYRIKVIDKPGAVAVDQPNGKVCEPGNTFTTDDIGWIESRRHWHYLEISEAEIVPELVKKPTNKETVKTNKKKTKKGLDK